jgi:small-conductance mechanosensitive channel
VRSQLAIPVSIISFSIFGYVSFAQNFNALELSTVTIVIDVLMGLSLASVLVAGIFLARTELTFMRVEMDDMEDLTDVGSEHEYFRTAYLYARKENALAARHRARSFLLLLVALAFFVGSVALLPFHLNDANALGRTGGADDRELALEV